MTKFMVLYNGPVAADKQMEGLSPEDMKKNMEPWVAWFKNCGKALVDGGTPLVNGMHLDKDSSSESKSIVTGYSILEAKDIDEMKKMLSDNPHFMMPNASIEVFEMMPMM